MPSVEAARRVEWPTLILVILVYLAWAVLLLAPLGLPGWLLVLLLAPVLTLHSSLQHEVLHGHPLPRRQASEALVFFPVGLFIPYERFRDLHLQHHLDSRLTDPYDDPESAYLDPVIWRRLPGWRKSVLRFNNTLLGRMAIGPTVSQITFMAAEWRAARAGDRDVLRGWVLHLAGLVPVLALVLAWGQVSLPAYMLAAYLGLSILKIRTFLEHQAHERASGRTVIIEDRGPLAFLFLNNNLHAVHHAHPKVPWYRLPGLFRARREHFLRRNRGYRYRSYGEVFRQYLLRRKEQVPHPLMGDE